MVNEAWERASLAVSLGKGAAEKMAELEKFPAILAQIIDQK